MFIPSLALALGACVGSSKPFEAIFTCIWYIGPLNRAVPLDFTQLSAPVVSATPWLLYSACGIGLAVAGRWMKLHR